MADLRPARAVSVWRCTDFEQAVAWLQSNEPDEGTPDIRALAKEELLLRQVWGDPRNAKERRKARIPDCVRKLWDDASQAVSLAEAASLRRLSCQLLASHVQALRLQRLHLLIKGGRAIKKPGA